MPFLKIRFSFFLFFVALQLFLVSCGITETLPTTYDINSTINSPTSTAFVKNLLFIIKPYIRVNGQNKYIVSDSIVNIDIHINNKEWGTYKSSALDTSIVSKSPISGYWLSSDTLKYSVVADNRFVMDSLKTAGAYANLMHNYLMLEAGDYIFELASFDVKLQNGRLKKIYPGVTKLLQITDKMTSLFVGEYSIEVK